MAALSSLSKQKNFGLLVFRVVIGLIFIVFHGYPKLIGGPEVWTKTGMSMSYLGINFLPVVWGFMAMAVELVGALFVVLGLWTRPSSLLLMLTMVVAYIYHTSAGDGWGVAEKPFILIFVFFLLVFTGPGKYSVDKR